MKTLAIAFKNLKQNLSFYALYLLSVSFVITIFYAFTSFSRNRVMLEKISENGRVESMCSTISVFLMIFVVFYMEYSNRFFLRRRIKELGIYTLLGYRKSAILLLLIFENILVCSGAFAVGIVFGAILHKGIVFGITALLKLSAESARIPLFNGSAAAETASFILLVVIILGVSNGKFLYRTSLMNLVRYEKRAEKTMKFRLFPASLGFIMIISGYVLAADIFRGSKSVWITVGFYTIGMVTMLLIVIGTVFFISSFLPYVMQKSKKNKHYFYTETNIITTPNFTYRIRSNARTLIMLTLLSAAALTVTSAMALTLYYPIAAAARIAPSEIELRIEDSNQAAAVKRLVKESVPDDGTTTFLQTDIFKATSSGSRLPVEYSLGTAKGDADNEAILRESGFECISYTNYISLLQAQGKYDGEHTELDEDECILVKYQPDSDENSKSGMVYPLMINGRERPLTVKAATLDNPVSFANSIGTLIVSDGVYDQLRIAATPVTSVMSINGKAVEDNEELYQNIRRMLNGSPYLQGQSHRIHEIFYFSSSTFLLIGFLVILFFIAVGSILYFNNISAVIETKADYEILLKMGYTDMQMKKLIKKQILAFFGIPFALGLTDSIFAMAVFKTGLMQNLLGNNFSQYIPAVLAIILTAAIYLIYYLFTVHACCKVILNK